jgi:hypothetical protein
LVSFYTARLGYKKILWALQKLIDTSTADNKGLGSHVAANRSTQSESSLLEVYSILNLSTGECWHLWVEGGALKYQQKSASLYRLGLLTMPHYRWFSNTEKENKGLILGWETLKDFNWRGCVQLTLGLPSKYPEGLMLSAS